MKTCRIPYENPAVLDSATILLFLAKIIKTNSGGLTY